MDPLLAVLLEPYIGGELEVKPSHSRRGHLFRGKIREISTTPGDGNSPATITVKLHWNAMAVDSTGEPGHFPEGEWVEDTELTYTCNTQNPRQDIWGDQQNTGSECPFVSAVSPNRSGIVIHDSVNRDMAVLTPNGRNRLDTSKVRWLDDGPWARHKALCS